MATQINVGDGSLSTAQNFISLGVFTGQTVNISNLAGGATLNYYINGIDGAASTLNAGSNVNVTTPTWIQSPSISSVVLSGGIY